MLALHVDRLGRPRNIPLQNHISQSLDVSRPVGPATDLLQTSVFTYDYSLHDRLLTITGPTDSLHLAVGHYAESRSVIDPVYKQRPSSSTHYSNTSLSTSISKLGGPSQILIKWRKRIHIELQKETIRAHQSKKYLD
ncbi:hypothetical protein Fot_06879 [Forsythia ovata]|uniref:Uncharacterized protein n=1 Tax=Forsythia ovata TaxID=205694 RepID=A0ABD1WU79_9LAMI